MTPLARSGLWPSRKKRVDLFNVRRRLRLLIHAANNYADKAQQRYARKDQERKMRRLYIMEGHRR